MNNIVLVWVTVLCVVGSTNAATYTWNGSAGDGDWTNTVNWDNGSYPAALSNSAESDTIIFNGANMPTLNVPGYTSALAALAANWLVDCNIEPVDSSCVPVP